MAVRITHCPKCGAICREGHDDDGQVFCAFCKTSFTPTSTEKISQKEYIEELENAAEIKNDSGWVAYKPKL